MNKLIEKKSFWIRLWCPHSWTDGEETEACMFNELMYTCYMCGKQKTYNRRPVSWIIR